MSRPNLDTAVFNKYMNIPLPANVCQVEYIWIGGTGADLRAKTKTLEKVPEKIEELPIWNYDGSSTGQAPGKDSEVYLQPVAMFADPFRGAPHLLVLCEACLPDGNLTPIPTNSRRNALKVMTAASKALPWFGIEQEYSLFHENGRTPFGFPDNGYPRPQGPYYCSIGTENAFGRRVVEAHYRACLAAGLKISGINAEVMPGQWEYQVGPCLGISSGDQMWMSRYIMQRVCEDFGVRVSFDPKPVSGDWNGAGAHTNYSTEEMRQPGGYAAIIAAAEKLGAKHEEHIRVYGEGNERRLTGHHETADIRKFSYGVANRGASIRIPRQAQLEGCGYLEDRRPASNMDPYVVTAKIVQTTVLDA
jgi:glutamine synthetase